MKPETLDKIKEASKKLKTFPMCTAENPMPAGDSSIWYHKDNLPMDGQTYPRKIGDSVKVKCVHCGHEFVLTLRNI